MTECPNKAMHRMSGHRATSRFGRSARPLICDLDRFKSLITMRYDIAVLLPAVTVLAGCHSPSRAHLQAPTAAVAAPRPSQPLFITKLGSTTITSDGVWRVVVSPTGDAVDLSYNQSAQVAPSFEAWSTIRVPGPTADAPGWKAHPGWFVFIENASRAWVYDGDHYLCLEIASGNGVGFYPTPRGFPCAVPAQVFSRLSEAAQKSIERHE